MLFLVRTINNQTVDLKPYLSPHFGEGGCMLSRIYIVTQTKFVWK